MREPKTSGISAANRRELEASLRKVWRLGANVILGWRALAHGIDVLYAASYDLPKIAKARPALMLPDRRITRDAEFDACVKAGCKKESIRLLFEIDRQSDTTSAIDEIIRSYSVTQSPVRAVALFDIVSFSLYPPFEQIVQVNVLSHYIKLAARRCQGLGMPVVPRMTTTGDGFYVWNAHEGLDADMALFAAVMLALGYNNAARKVAEKDTPSVPRLRCGIHFGTHYEFYQGGSGTLETGGYIVGEVTINLARLISKARTNQLLVGAYTRELGATEKTLAERTGLTSVDTPTFMALAQANIAKLAEAPIPGGKIEEVTAYFTGPRISDDTFSIRKYYVPDKHGLDHPCYNAKLTIKTSAQEEISFGLMDHDLQKFDAHFDEDEDILIKLG